MLTILSAIGLVFLAANLVLYSMRLSGKNIAYIFFVTYLLFIGIIDLLALVYSLNDLNNHFLSSYYLFFRFLLLSGFFYHLFSPINKKRSLLVRYIAILISIVFFAQYLIEPSLYYTFNSMGFLITGSALMIFAVFYLFENLSKKLAFQYVSIGLFLYLTSSSLIFVSAIFIVSLKEINILIWNTNAILFIVYQLLILWEWKQSFSQKVAK